MLEQLAQEQVEVHARELLGEHGGGGHVGQGACHGGVVAVHEEVLLHADAHLREHVAHAVGVLKDGLGPHLARDTREFVHLFGEGAGRDEQPRARELPVGLRGDLGGKGEEAQVGADVAVEFAGAHVLGGELLHKAREDRYVRQLGKGEVREVEVRERVGELVRGQVMAQAGDRRLLVDGELGFGARGPDVAHVQARQGRLGLGRVLGLLALAQERDVVHDALELRLAERCLCGGELGFLLACGLRVVCHGDELHEGAMTALEHDLAQQVLKERGVQGLLELVVHGAVLQRACGGFVGVLVEPRAERVAGDCHAVGDAEVALAQVELLAGKHGGQAVAGDALFC